MPLPVISNVARVSVSGSTSSGTQWANVQHYQRLTPPMSATNIGQLFDEIVKLYSVAYAGAPTGIPFMTPAPTSTTLTELRLTPLDGSSASTVRTVALAGTQADGTLPTEVSACMSIITGLRGRRNRGRIYLPPFSEAQNDNLGQINSTILAGLVAQAERFRSAIVALAWDIGVASYGGPSGTPPVTWTPYFTPAASFRVDPYWDTQRRRGRPR